MDRGFRASREFSKEGYVIQPDFRILVGLPTKTDSGKVPRRSSGIVTFGVWPSHAELDFPVA